MSQIGGAGPLNGSEASTNTWFGLSAGASITNGLHNSFFGFKTGYYTSGGTSPSGSRNSFFGSDTGVANTVGNHNSYFGSAAGYLNQTGSGNSFFGAHAGYSNVTEYNSYFGTQAGYSNTTGPFNSFFGAHSGYANDGGWYNSFFGNEAGRYNTTGHYNAFIGNYAGLSNTRESNNTFIGASSDGAAGVFNATALGFHAKVTQSNSLVLGGINGINGGTADTQGRYRNNGSSGKPSCSKGGYLRGISQPGGNPEIAGWNEVCKTVDRQFRHFDHYTAGLSWHRAARESDIDLSDGIHPEQNTHLQMVCGFELNLVSALGQ